MKSVLLGLGMCLIGSTAFATNFVSSDEQDRYATISCQKGGFGAATYPRVRIYDIRTIGIMIQFTTQEGLMRVWPQEQCVIEETRK